MPTVTPPTFATIRTATTPEQRIAVVAWRWNRQYSYRNEYIAAGYSEDQIADGEALGYAMSEEYYHNRCYYGDPAYGSWPADVKQPIRDKVRNAMRLA